MRRDITSSDLMSVWSSAASPRARAALLGGCRIVKCVAISRRVGQPEKAGPLVRLKDSIVTCFVA
jgi:hypothetical protein